MTKKILTEFSAGNRLDFGGIHLLHHCESANAPHMYAVESVLENWFEN